MDAPFCLFLCDVFVFYTVFLRWTKFLLCLVVCEMDEGGELYFITSFQLLSVLFRETCAEISNIKYPENSIRRMLWVCVCVRNIVVYLQEWFPPIFFFFFSLSL